MEGRRGALRKSPREWTEQSMGVNDVISSLEWTLFLCVCRLCTLHCFDLEDLSLRVLLLFSFCAYLHVLQCQMLSPFFFFFFLSFCLPISWLGGAHPTYTGTETDKQRSEAGSQLQAESMRTSVFASLYPLNSPALYNSLGTQLSPLRAHMFLLFYEEWWEKVAQFTLNVWKNAAYSSCLPILVNSFDTLPTVRSALTMIQWMQKNRSRKWEGSEWKEKQGKEMKCVCVCMLFSWTINGEQRGNW